MATIEDIYEGMPGIFSGSMFSERLKSDNIQKPKYIDEYLISKGCYILRQKWTKPGTKVEPVRSWQDSVPVGSRPWKHNDY